MARILIAGDAVVVESALTNGQLKMVEKYRPDSLAIKNEDGEVEFAVATAPKGLVSSFGVSFCTCGKADNAKASVTMPLPAGTADAKAYVSDTYGPAVRKLAEIEAGYEAAKSAIDADKAAIDAMITVA